MLINSRADLRQLQIAQYRHDEVAHRDIAWLPVPQRLTHFTLHFAKYAGALVRANRAHDEVEGKRVLADAFAIVLAMANTLQIDLRARTQAEPRDENLSNYDVRDLLLCLCEAIGPMAKACEAIDHLENFPSRSTLDHGVLRVLEVISALAEKEGVSLPDAVTARWALAEKKSFLFEENRKVEVPSFLSAA